MGGVPSGMPGGMPGGMGGGGMPGGMGNTGGGGLGSEFFRGHSAEFERKSMALLAEKAKADRQRNKDLAEERHKRERVRLD